MTTVVDKLFAVIVAVLLPSLAYGFPDGQPLGDPANIFTSQDQSFEYMQQEVKRLMHHEQEKQKGIKDHSGSISIFNILIDPYFEFSFLNPGDPASVDRSGLNNSLPLDIVIGDGSQLLEVYMTVAKYGALPTTQMLFVIWNIDRYKGDFYNYTARAEAVPFVASYTASLIKAIQASNKPISSSDMHLISFGVGAHAAGVAANSVNGIGLITGIDPPALYFENSLKRWKLDKGDADKVVVIHTSDMSIKKPIGHIDYYVVFGDSYNQHPYSSLRDFDHCYHKLAAIAYPLSIAVPANLDHVDVISAYKCKSAKKLKSGKCLNNKVAPFGYFGSTTMKGKYYLQLDNFNSTVFSGNVLIFSGVEYCVDNPTFVRTVAVQILTSSPRNQGFIMASSYAEDVGYFNFTSTYKEILNSKAKSPGKVDSYLNVPLFVPTKYLRFRLRYRNRLNYAGNFNIARIIFTLRNGTQEVNYGACNIELKPFAEPTTLVLRPGLICI